MATPDPGLPRNIGAPATRALTAAGYTELGQVALTDAGQVRLVVSARIKFAHRLPEGA